MPRLMKRHSQNSGLPPGTLLYLGDKQGGTTITVIDYDKNDVRERAIEAPEECRQYVDKSTVTWINVIGLHDTETLQKVGDVFAIHPLAMEDVVSSGQRPKMEDHGEYILLTLKMLYRQQKTGAVVAEQVSIILGRDYVLTFQEVEGDVFDVIRTRIRTAKGRIRGMGCDYLAYALLDAIVDNYFIVLEDVGDRIEDLQDQVIKEADPETLQVIHRLKGEMIFMRKNLWPLRELVGGLEKSESPLVGDSLAPYLRDVYEHTVQVIDTVESQRDMLAGTLDIYMTTVSNRMNEVMKVLTVIATIFIPLTFIAGVYGMNFETMPELKCPWGYAAVWTVMILVGLGMVAYFKSKKWF